MKKRTNIYLDDEDHAAIALIRERYLFLESDAHAVRFVLREKAATISEERKKASRKKKSSPEHEEQKEAKQNES